MTLDGILKKIQMCGRYNKEVNGADDTEKELDDDSEEFKELDD
jgi:hypothetical protein